MAATWFSADDWKGFATAQFSSQADPFAELETVGSKCELKVDFLTQETIPEDDPAAADFLMDVADPLLRLGYLEAEQLYQFQNAFETAKTGLQTRFEAWNKTILSWRKRHFQTEMQAIEKQLRSEQAAFFGLVSAALDVLLKEAGLPKLDPFAPTTLSLLETMVTFEKPVDVPLPFPLKLHDRGLAIRILQYRLMLLGFYHHRVDGQFQEQTLLGWHLYFQSYQAGGLLPQMIDQQAFELLGNPFALSKRQFHLMGGAHFGFQLLAPNPVATKVAAQPIVVRFSGNQQNLPTSKVPLGLNAGGYLSSAGDPVTRDQMELWLRRSPAAVRLIQLRLWMEGYYEGFQDGMFQDASVVALRDFLLEELSLSTANLLDTYLCIYDDFLIMSPKVFELFGLERETAKAAIKAETMVLNTADKVTEQGIAWEREQQDKTWFQRAWSWFKSTVKKVGQGIKHLFARAYSGIKQFVVRIARAIGKGLQVFGRHIKRGFQFLSLVARRVARGFAVFWQRVKDFIRFLEDPGVHLRQTDASLTIQFVTGFDAVVLAKSSAGGQSENLSALVGQAENWMNRSWRNFSWTTRFVFLVLSAIKALATAPIAWMKSAIDIYRKIAAFIAQNRQIAAGLTP